MPDPQPKDADTICPVFLERTRRRKCAFCPAPAPSDPHHYPPKGMGGRHVDDTRVLPVCRSCHDRCAGITVVVNGERLGPISEAEQERAALENLRAFVDEAGPLELELFTRALLERWRNRHFGALVPF